MDEFFKKYPMPVTEKDALDMIHSRICFVQKLYVDDPSGTTYLTEAAGVATMINDFFISKGINMADYMRQTAAA